MANLTKKNPYKKIPCWNFEEKHIRFYPQFLNSRQCDYIYEKN